MASPSPPLPIYPDLGPALKWLGFAIGGDVTWRSLEISAGVDAKRTPNGRHTDATRTRDVGLDGGLDGDGGRPTRSDAPQGPQGMGVVTDG